MHVLGNTLAIIAGWEISWEIATGSKTVIIPGILQKLLGDRMGRGLYPI